MGWGWGSRGSGVRFRKQVRRLKPWKVPRVLVAMRALHTVRDESWNTDRGQVMKSLPF